jgi:hypothetical protein
VLCTARTVVWMEMDARDELYLSLLAAIELVGGHVRVVFYVSFNKRGTSGAP